MHSSIFNTSSFIKHSIHFFFLGLFSLLLSHSVLASDTASSKPAALNNSSVVIVYHHDANHTPAVSTIHPEKFKEHMAYLSKHNFNVWPLPKILSTLKAGESLPPYTIALTFDDGYTDTYTNAFPVLKKYNFPFTLFINSDKADIATKSSRTNSYASWAMIKEMRKQGATIANHTANHVHMATKLKDENDKQWLGRIKANIEKGHKRITEQTGVVPTLLAYPYGEYNDAVVNLMKDLGYTAAFGMNSGAFSAHDNFFALPRFAEGGHYVDTHDFGLRVKTKPLPLKSVIATNEILDHNNGKPTLELILEPGKYRMAELACYGVGQGKLTIESISKYHLKITPNKNIPSGRSTYNCTMPGYDGRFYWYSHPFNRRLADGTIIHD